MSFSGKLRAEVAGIIPSGKQSRETATAVLLLNLGTFSRGEAGGIELRLSGGNPAALRKCFTMIQKTVTIKPDFSHRDLSVKKNADGGRPGGKRPVVTGEEGLSVTISGGSLPGLLERMQVLGPDGEILARDGTLPQEFVCGKRGRAYLREMFLCTGFMSDPGSRYHLEFRCSSQPQADQLLEVLEENGIRAGQTRRKSYQVVYVKDSETIAALLQLMGASVSLMATENARILKDVRNQVNRRVNCEAANIGKTVVSAGHQLEDIRLLREKGILRTLPAQLQEAASLREEHPGASLAELGELSEPPVGRSGMNHRFRKLSVIARKAKDDFKEDRLNEKDPVQGAVTEKE